RTPKIEPPPLGAPAIAPVPRASAGGRAARFWGTFGLLGGVAVVAVVVYGKAPWASPDRPSSAAPAVPAVDARAARVKALTGEIEASLAAHPTFVQVSALEDRLARLRDEGAIGAAGALAARAARALEEVATRELDAGDIDVGVAHYKIALGVDPGAQGTSQLEATLRARAKAALAADRSVEAVRWARAAVGLAEADPDAHALLAESLFASRDAAGAAVEFGKALASRPTDPAFKRGLERARRRVARAAARSHAHDVAPSPGGETAPANDTPGDDKDEPSEKEERKKPARGDSTAGEAAPEQ
ncbi:MAG TPA: hypothetical protein VH560_19940, partial [Polyangia bacterium]|nr:hypothetical protein [Polyangia bacterium]